MRAGERRVRGDAIAQGGMGFLASGKAGLGDEGKIGLAAAGLAWLTAAFGKRRADCEDNEEF
jgi:hypothetical protein